MSLLNLLHLVASISPHCLQSASRLRASLRCRLPHLPSFLSPFSIFLSVSRNIVIILSHVNWGVSEAITKRGARQQQLTGGREGQDTQEAKPGRIRLSLTRSPFAYATHTKTVARGADCSFCWALQTEIETYPLIPLMLDTDATCNAPDPLPVCCGGWSNIIP